MKTALLTMPKNRWAMTLAIVAGLITLPAFGVWTITQTEWFENEARQRMVGALEAATGGSGQIDEVSFSFADFGFRVQQLTLRGTEPASEPPLFSVPTVRMQLGLDSLLRRRLSLRTLELDSPQIQITIAADGSSNFPRPQRGRQGAGMFDLVVDNFNLAQGGLVWNGSRYRLSVAAKDFDVQTQFEEDEGRYTARLRLGDSTAELGDLRPIVSEGEAELLLYPDRIEVTQVRLAVGETKLSASGRVDGWQRPNADFRFEAYAALRPLAEWLKDSTVQGGFAKLSGAARWQGATNNLAYNGDLAVTGAALRSDPISIGNVSAAGKFFGTQSGFSVLPLEFSALERNFAGSLTVENLHGAGVPRIIFECEVEALELESLLATADPEHWSPDSLAWSSRVDASITVEGPWDELDANLSLVLALPEVPASERIPIEGIVDLHYDGGRQAAELSRLDLATPSSRFEAGGIIAARSASRLHLKARMRTPADLVAVLRVRDPSVTAASLPFEPVGDMIVEGDLTGEWFTAPAPVFRFQGRVETGKIRVREYDLERVEARVDYSPTALRVMNARLQDGTGAAAITLTLPLEDGKIAPDEPLSAEVEVQNLEAQRLLAATGWGAPIAGVLGARLHVKGSLSQPRGDAEIEIRDGTAWEIPFDRVTAAVDFTERQLAVKSLEMLRQEGRVRATGDYELETREFRLSLASQDWPLRNLPGIGPDFEGPRGTLRFDLSGSGKLSSESDSFEQLRLAGGWSTDELSYSDHTLGKLSGEIETVANEVTLNWRGDLLSGQMEGKATLLPQGPLSGEVKFEKLSAVSLASFVGMPLERAVAELDGSCSFQSQTLSLDDLQVEGVITRLEGGFSEIPGSEREYEMWNPFPMRWSFADRTLRLDRMRLLGDGTDVDINGTVQLDEPRDMDVEIDGTFNLAVLESFRSDFSASGSSTLEVKLTGSLKDPSVVGQMQLRDGSVRSQDFPNGLNQMNGRVSFAGRQVRIEEVTASTGGGNVRLTGNALLADGSASYRLIAEADRVRVRYPESVSSILNGRFTLSGTGLTSLLGGQVTIHRAAISPDVDLGRILATLGEPTRTPASSPILSNLQLNIQVSSVPGLDVDTQVVRDMETRIDLRVTGTALQPSLLGRISVTQGEVRFQGSRYTINRGDIEFINPFRLEPVVNFELETRVRDVDVALFLSGPARKMNLSFRSDPPLRFNELVSLIAIGRAPSQDPVFAAQQTVEQQHLLQAGASTVLGNALTQPVSGRLQRFFGVSRLRVDPQLGGAEADPSARISTEQQITNDLTLIYSYDLSSAQQQVVRVEWAPNRRWSVIFTRDENGLVGGDLLYKKRLR